MLASLAMALRYSFNLGETADRVEKAISVVLDKGLRTADIWTEGTEKVGTVAMGDAILAELEQG
jgi:3-isopropylmalate dehydrogenase